MSSGSDWSDRMRKLAARAPNLDIFSDKLVLRDDAGWQITDGGRQVLVSLETPIPETQGSDRPTVHVPAIAVAVPVQPALRLVVDNTRSSKSDSGPDETRRSA
jgi:hypothetical protein